MTFVRIFSIDHYMAAPILGLDTTYSQFRGKEVKQVPVLRIFGANQEGLKTCLHVHGVFPYLHVPHNESNVEATQKLCYRVATSLDKAINILLGQTNSNTQHVFDVIPVAGIPLYGYHSGKHQFLKIRFFNPFTVKKAAQLLQNGAILDTIFQPHDAHIQYELQFMIDYNLHGMNNIYLSEVKYRRTDAEEDDSSPIPSQYTILEDVSRISTCKCEIDCTDKHILNVRDVISGELSANPGISAIWEEERTRRRLQGKNSQELGPKSSQFREKVQDTDSEVYFKKRLMERLSLGKISEVNTVSNQSVYPAEVPENSQFLDASISHLIDSLKVLSPVKETKFDDSVINENLILSLTQNQHISSTKNPNDFGQLYDALVDLAEEGKIDDDSILSQRPFDILDDREISAEDEIERESTNLEQTIIENDQLNDVEGSEGNYSDETVIESEKDYSIFYDDVIELQKPSSTFERAMISQSATRSSGKSKEITFSQFSDNSDFDILITNIDKEHYLSDSSDSLSEFNGRIPQIDGALVEDVQKPKRKYTRKRINKKNQTEESTQQTILCEVTGEWRKVEVPANLQNGISDPVVKPARKRRTKKNTEPNCVCNSNRNIEVVNNIPKYSETYLPLQKNSTGFPVQDSTKGIRILNIDYNYKPEYIDDKDFIVLDLSVSKSTSPQNPRNQVLTASSPAKDTLNEFSFDEAVHQEVLNDLLKELEKCTQKEDTHSKSITSIDYGDTNFLIENHNGDDIFETFSSLESAKEIKDQRTVKSLLSDMINAIAPEEEYQVFPEIDCKSYHNRLLLNDQGSWNVVRVQCKYLRKKRQARYRRMLNPSTKPDLKFILELDSNLKPVYLKDFENECTYENFLSKSAYKSLIQAQNSTNEVVNNVPITEFSNNPEFQNNNAVENFCTVIPTENVGETITLYSASNIENSTEFQMPSVINSSNVTEINVIEDENLIKKPHTEAKNNGGDIKDWSSAKFKIVEKRPWATTKKTQKDKKQNSCLDKVAVVELSRTSLDKIKQLDETTKFKSEIAKSNVEIKSSTNDKSCKSKRRISKLINLFVDSECHNSTHDNNLSSEKTQEDWKISYVTTKNEDNVNKKQKNKKCTVRSKTSNVQKIDSQETVRSIKHTLKSSEESKDSKDSIEETIVAGLPLLNGERSENDLCTTENQKEKSEVVLKTNPETENSNICKKMKSKFSKLKLKKSQSKEIDKTCPVTEEGQVSKLDNSEQEINERHSDKIDTKDISETQISVENQENFSEKYAVVSDDIVLKEKQENVEEVKELVDQEVQNESQQNLKIVCPAKELVVDENETPEGQENINIAQSRSQLQSDKNQKIVCRIPLTHVQPHLLENYQQERVSVVDIRNEEVQVKKIDHCVQTIFRTPFRVHSKKIKYKRKIRKIFYSKSRCLKLASLNYLPLKLSRNCRWKNLNKPNKRALLKGTSGRESVSTSISLEDDMYISSDSEKFENSNMVDNQKNVTTEDKLPEPFPETAQNIPENHEINAIESLTKDMPPLEEIPKSDVTEKVVTPSESSELVANNLDSVIENRSLIEKIDGATTESTKIDNSKSPIDLNVLSLTSPTVSAVESKQLSDRWNNGHSEIINKDRFPSIIVTIPNVSTLDISSDRELRVVSISDETSVSYVQEDKSETQTEIEETEEEICFENSPLAQSSPNISFKNSSKRSTLAYKISNREVRSLLENGNQNRHSTFRKRDLPGITTRNRTSQINKKIKSPKVTKTSRKVSTTSNEEAESLKEPPKKDNLNIEDKNIKSRDRSRTKKNPVKSEISSEQLNNQTIESSTKKQCQEFTDQENLKVDQDNQAKNTTQQSEKPENKKRKTRRSRKIRQHKNSSNQNKIEEHQELTEEENLICDKPENIDDQKDENEKIDESEKLAVNESLALPDTTNSTQSIQKETKEIIKNLRKLKNKIEKIETVDEQVDKLTEKNENTSVRMSTRRIKLTEEENLICDKPENIDEQKDENEKIDESEKVAGNESLTLPDTTNSTQSIQKETKEIIKKSRKLKDKIEKIETVDEQVDKLTEKNENTSVRMSTRRIKLTEEENLICDKPENINDQKDENEKIDENEKVAPNESLTLSDTTNSTQSIQKETKEIIKKSRKLKDKIEKIETVDEQADKLTEKDENTSVRMSTRRIKQTKNNCKCCSEENGESSIVKVSSENKVDKAIVMEVSCTLTDQINDSPKTGKNASLNKQFFLEPEIKIEPLEEICSPTRKKRKSDSPTKSDIKGPTKSQDQPVLPRPTRAAKLNASFLIQKRKFIREISLETFGKSKKQKTTNGSESQDSDNGSGRHIFQIDGSNWTETEPSDAEDDFDQSLFFVDGLNDEDMNRITNCSVVLNKLNDQTLKAFQRSSQSRSPRLNRHKFTSSRYEPLDVVFTKSPKSTENRKITDASQQSHARKRLDFPEHQGKFDDANHEVTAVRDMKNEEGTAEGFGIGEFSVQPFSSKSPIPEKQDIRNNKKKLRLRKTKNQNSDLNVIQTIDDQSDLISDKLNRSLRSRILVSETKKSLQKVNFDISFNNDVSTSTPIRKQTSQSQNITVCEENRICSYKKQSSNVINISQIQPIHTPSAPELNSTLIIIDEDASLEKLIEDDSSDDYISPSPENITVKPLVSPKKKLNVQKPEEKYSVAYEYDKQHNFFPKPGPSKTLEEDNKSESTNSLKSDEILNCEIESFYDQTFHDVSVFKSKDSEPPQLIRKHSTSSDGTIICSQNQSSSQLRNFRSQSNEMQLSSLTLSSDSNPIVSQNKVPTLNLSTLNIKFKNVINRFTKDGLVVLMPLYNPPSYDDIKRTLLDYNIPEVPITEPFYSKPTDVTGRIEIGHKILKIPSKIINDLPEFTSQLQYDTIKKWRERQFLNLHSTQSQIPQIDKNLNIIKCFATNREILITPVAKPPTSRDIELWLRAKEYLKKNYGKLLENLPKKIRIKIPSSPTNEMAEDSSDDSMSLSPCTPKTSQDSLDRSATKSSSDKETGLRPSPVLLDKQKKHKLRNRRLRISLMKTFTEKSMLETIKESTVENSQNDTSENLSHSLTSLDSYLNKAEHRKALLTPTESRNSSCLITGATLNNTYGFKAPSENYQNARAISKHQYLTTLIVEIHVKTRGDLRPDPNFDPITALFYSVHNDVPENYQLPQSEMGVFCLKSEHGILTRKYKGTQITYVENEIEIFDSLVLLFKKWDPDILVGYEIEMLSWGFILERGFRLDLNLPKNLSRIPDSRTNTRIDDNGNISELRFTGRIFLELWRLMRHEIALYSYTFENVVYHLLHQRLPKHSFHDLTAWYENPLTQWITLEYYLKRVKGIWKLLDQLDFIGRTSELARLFGIQFYEVLSRGSQFRVESMMLRLAKPLNYIPVSPSVKQRAKMKAPEFLPLIMEPDSKLYLDPIIVLDFQSLYPSMMIAYNYCFSTCLGCVDRLGQTVPFEFGATQLRVDPRFVEELLKQDKLNISPCGAVFVDKSVRHGILPRMLKEILDCRLMVKQSMKDNKEDATLQKVLHSRQLGLKLIANVTYGYTAANFSGRMPCVELGDSVVSKGRETLERAIKLVEQNESWRVKVVYGDTDSLFIMAPGRSRQDAFRIGAEIAEAVTKDNPTPVKLKLEKIYQPCILQTKKRYVGYMYESPDQQQPTYDAKGIETVRRDGCPAVAKILEKTLRILFETKDMSLVKQYVCRQFFKLVTGRANIQDLIFAKEFRGPNGYRPGAMVPALELARRYKLQDPRAEPRRSERVPYIIVSGPPGSTLVRLARNPKELLDDPALIPHVQYYITKVIIPPLNRCLMLCGADVYSWFNEMPRKQLLNYPTTITTNKCSKKSTIAQHFATTSCVRCANSTQDGICRKCLQNPQVTVFILQEKLRNWERTHFGVQKICYSCCGRFEETNCISLDCPVLYRLNQAQRDFQQAPFVRNLINDKFSASSLHCAIDF